MEHFFQLSLVILALVAGIVGPIVWQFTTNIGPLKKLQAQAEAALQGIDKSANDKQFSLCGSEAVVEKKEEEEVTWSGYGVTILAYRCTFFVRNVAGEYFMVIYRHDAKPYVKHIPHDIARVKLGDKYVAKKTANA